MTPPSGPQSPTTPTNQYETATSFPGLSRSATAPHSLSSSQQQPLPHRSHLAPEDAYIASPPRHLGSSSPATAAARGGPASAAPHVPSGATLSTSAAVAATTLAAGRGGGYDSLDDRRGRSRSRRRKKKQYKKLLWVKQSYRDNHTDQATFLESLQRNPRLQPYQFWTLFSDSTVIVQQVCAVVVFTVCFSLIFQERLSCNSVAAGGSLATFLGWLIWTMWEWRAQDAAEAKGKRAGGSPDDRWASANGSMEGDPLTRPSSAAGGRSSTNLAAVGGLPLNRLSQSASMTSLPYTNTTTSSSLAPRDIHNSCFASGSESGISSSRTHARHHNRRLSHEPPSAHSRQPSTEPPPPSQQATHPQLSRNHSRQTSYDPASDTVNLCLRRRDTTSPGQGRWQNLVGTIKSSVLIVFFVGAVSPILKSLTRSFASDSIWAMSSFLLLINLFFFDYSIGISPPATTVGVAAPGPAIGGGGLGGGAMGLGGVAGMPRSGPAAFALNSATMASTVLASRLPQTSQVFSLTIFSMEMFALFPIFRRYARHHSLPAHVLLTSVLIVGAGAGTGIAFGRPEDWVRNAARGVVISVLSSVLAMGGCSYWLISLQKYKNAIIGPWDPARPVITGPGPGGLSRMQFQQD